MEECCPISKEASSHPLDCTTWNSQTSTANKSEQIQSLNINTHVKFPNKETWNQKKYNTNIFSQCFFRSRSIDGGAFFLITGLHHNPHDFRDYYSLVHQVPIKIFLFNSQKRRQMRQSNHPPSSPAEGRRATELFWQIQIIIFKKYDWTLISWI